MTPIARNVTDGLEGFPRGKGYPILDATYSRSTDELTVSGQPVQPSGGTIDTGTASSATVMDFLSRNLFYILGFLGVLLIVVGLVWFWQSGMSSQSENGRMRHASHSQPESAGSDGQIYCHQCGKRAQPSDKFCRACGTLNGMYRLFYPT